MQGLEVGAPAAECGDVFGAFERVRLAEEAVHLAPVREVEAADAERRRHEREEGAHGAARQAPDLDIDRRPRRP